MVGTLTKRPLQDSRERHLASFELIDLSDKEIVSRCADKDKTIAQIVKIQFSPPELNCKALTAALYVF